MTAELDDPFILLYDRKISNMKDILPLLEQTMGMDRTMLIIAEDVDGEALSTLVVNKVRGTLKVATVKAPAILPIKPIPFLLGVFIPFKDFSVSFHSLRVAFIELESS